MRGGVPDRRTIVGGTIVGVTLAAVVLALHPAGLPVAVAAAAALSFAVLTAPKLYGLSVIGITASALMASSIGSVDPVLPGIRLVDTPDRRDGGDRLRLPVVAGARQLPISARLDAAATALRAYLEEAVKPPGARVRWQSRRDDAYRLGHQVRAAIETALLEPPPVSSLATQMISPAQDLEALADAVTEVVAMVEAGLDPKELVNDAERRLADLDVHRQWG